MIKKTTRAETGVAEMQLTDHAVVAALGVTAGSTAWVMLPDSLQQSSVLAQSFTNAAGVVACAGLAGVSLVGAAIALRKESSGSLTASFGRAAERSLFLGFTAPLLAAAGLLIAAATGVAGENKTPDVQVQPAPVMTTHAVTPVIARPHATR
jgi:hypothetical protein